MILPPRLVFPLLLAAFLLLASCGGEPPAAPEPREVRAETVTLAARRALECRSLPGRVEPRTSAVLSSKISGTVTAVLAEEGDLVQKGAPILQIDDSELRQREQGAQAGVGQAAMERKALAAQVALARTTLARMKTLLDQQAVSREDFDKAQAEFLALKSREEALAAQESSAAHQSAEVRSLLSYSTVTAPFTGVLARRHVDQGAFVSAGSPLAEIDDAQGGYDLDAQADESLLSRLHTGMTVLGLAPSLSPEPFLTSLGAVIPRVDPATRTFRVKAPLPPLPGDAKPRSGLFGKVCVPLNPAKKLLVPAQAVRMRGELPTALVADTDGVLRLRLLKLGGGYLQAEIEGVTYILQAQAGEEAPGMLREVLSGLSEGDVLVVSADQTLREGDRLARP